LLSREKNHAQTATGEKKRTPRLVRPGGRRRLRPRSEIFSFLYAEKKYVGSLRRRSGKKGKRVLCAAREEALLIGRASPSPSQGGKNPRFRRERKELRDNSMNEPAFCDRIKKGRVRKCGWEEERKSHLLLPERGKRAAFRTREKGRKASRKRKKKGRTGGVRKKKGEKEKRVSSTISMRTPARTVILFSKRDPFPLGGGKRNEPDDHHLRKEQEKKREEFPFTLARRGKRKEKNSLLSNERKGRKKTGLPSGVILIPKRGALLPTSGRGRFPLRSRERGLVQQGRGKKERGTGILLTKKIKKSSTKGAPCPGKGEFYSGKKKREFRLMER